MLFSIKDDENDKNRFYTQKSRRFILFEQQLCFSNILSYIYFQSGRIECNISSNKMTNTVIKKFEKGNTTIKNI